MQSDSLESACLKVYPIVNSADTASEVCACAARFLRRHCPNSRRRGRNPYAQASFKEHLNLCNTVATGNGGC